MALNIEQLITVAAPVVMKELKLDYVLGAVHEVPYGSADLNAPKTAFYALLIDPKTNKYCPISWTRNDDPDTTEKRIALVKDLLVNAAHAIEILIEENIEQPHIEEVGHE